jgi:hypothetical protein
MLTETMSKIKQELYVKFDDSKIKEKQGRGGRYKFIPAPEVIDRLNDVFGINWSVTEEDSLIVNNHVVKRVRITVRDPETGHEYHKEQFGGHPLGNMDPGDAFKSAFSKAMVKAAAELGIGLHLWGIDEEDEPVVTAATTSPPSWGPNMGANSPQGNPAQAVRPIVAPPVAPRPMPQFPGPQLPVKSEQPPVTPIQEFVVPAGAPSAGGTPVIDTSQAQGMTSGPGTSATAQVSFQAAPQQQGGQAGGALEVFQINAIKGMSGRYQLDPVSVIYTVLGEEAQNNGIAAVEQLTYEQAQKVLSYLRSLNNTGN